MAMKLAAPGPDQSEALEKSLAALAHTDIKSKAPSLLNRLVGFQLVDKTEDDRKAMGIFGFRLGNDWAYIPVMFRNGAIKGTDMVYLKGPDLVVPLKEDWINFVLRQDRETLGESTDNTPGNKPTSYNDLHKFTESPFSKFSSADRDLPPLHPVMGIRSLKAVSNLLYGEKTASVAKSPVLDLKDIFSRHPRLLKRAMSWYSRYPKVRWAFDEVYGHDGAFELFKSAAENCREKLSKRGSYLNHIRWKGARPENPLRIGKQKKASSGVRVITYSAMTLTSHTPLNEEDRKRLLEDGLVIQDDREDSDVTRVARYSEDLDFTTPNCDGAYDILMSDLTLKRLCYLHGFTGPVQEAPLAIVLDPKPSGVSPHERVEPMQIWAKGASIQPVPAVESMLKSMPDLGETTLEEDATYLLYDDGTKVAPFTVDKQVSENLYDITFRYYPHAGPWDRRYREHNSTDKNWISETYENGPVRLKVTDQPGTGIVRVRGTVSVPTRCKVVKLATKEDRFGNPCCGPNGNPDNPGLAFGDLDDLRLHLHRKTASLKVSCGPGEVMIEGPEYQTSLSKMAAVVHLVTKEGMRESVARQIIKEAEDRRGAVHRYLLKRAEIIPQDTIVPPDFPDPRMGSGIMGHPRFPTEEASYDELEFDGLKAPQSEMLDVDDAIDPELSAYLQSAASKGQKEVFDYTMIEGLLKSFRVDSEIESCLPELMKAMDKVGRLRILLNWHTDRFEDRFGKQDIPELEDSLSNVFDGMGSLTLYLQEKEGRPFGVSDTLSTPTLDETA